MGFSNLCVVTVALSDGKDICLVPSVQKTVLDYMPKIAFLRGTLRNIRHYSSFSSFMMNLRAGSEGRI